MLEQKKLREAKNVSIVDYEAKYAKVFKSLNEKWISQHFVMEKSDLYALDNPKENILDKGGHILIALYKGEAVGTCALLKTEDSQYDYELAKMAVSENAKGKGIGYILGKETINKAKAEGAKSIYLESNRILKPAISLYLKLGFKEVVGIHSPYERCNIQMELKLK